MGLYLIGPRFLVVTRVVCSLGVVQDATSTTPWKLSDPDHAPKGAFTAATTEENHGDDEKTPATVPRKEEDGSLGAVCRPHPACPALATPGAGFMAADAIARCADAAIGDSPLSGKTEKQLSLLNKQRKNDQRRPWSVLIRGGAAPALPLPCSAPVVVGIPGGPGADVGYLSWLAGLTKSGSGARYSVLLLDPAGGGRSGGLSTPNEDAEAWVKQSAQDVHAALSYWRGGKRTCSETTAERVVVVGHSVGAAIAQGYAKLFSTAGQFLLSPATRMARWQKDAELYDDILQTPFAVGIPALNKKKMVQSLVIKSPLTGESEPMGQGMLSGYEGAHPWRMLEHVRAFVMGPDLKQVPDMCSAGVSVVPKLYDTLWGIAENEVTGAFGSLEQKAAANAPAAHFGVGLLDEATPATALWMAGYDYPRVVVLTLFIVVRNNLFTTGIAYA